MRHSFLFYGSDLRGFFCNEILIKKIKKNVFALNETRRNPLLRQVLKIDEPATLLASNFNASLPTKFFAHGWNAGPGSADSTRNGILIYGEKKCFLTNGTVIDF